MNQNLHPREYVSKFFAHTAPSYDKIVFFLTFGRDRFWKHKILDHVFGNLILDLACGTGILTRLIAQKFPESHIVGIDVTESYLDIAKQNSKEFQKIDFLIQDAEALNLERKFDCITASYLPKYCDAKIIVKKCIKHLVPGGIVILHDFTYPKNSFIQSLWNLYFHSLKIVGCIIPNWKDALFELPKIIRSSNWAQDYTSELEKNGFQVDSKYYTFGASYIIFARLPNT